MRQYKFDEMLAMSHGRSGNSEIGQILMDNIPGALGIHRAHEINDRQGTDWRVEHASGKHLSVDCKIRSKDYSQEGRDDLALETWPVVEKCVPGWTRNENKRTDYVLRLWIDSGRWCLIPFGMLCGVFRDMWRRWSSEYGINRQYTPRADKGYHSECIFVPRRIVWTSIYQKYGG